MIQLQWKQILSRVEHNGHRPIVKTVLQYRQQLQDDPATWTAWQDVPTVQEIVN